jgi:hypothetical protein
MLIIIGFWKAKPVVLRVVQSCCSLYPDEKIGMLAAIRFRLLGLVVLGVGCWVKKIYQCTNLSGF